MHHARLTLAAASLVLATLPAPAFASTDNAEPEDTGRALSELQEQLGDPARQQQLASVVTAMSHMLLDLPLAPIAKAVSEMGAEAGSDMADNVRPDATLRNIAPGADELPERIAQDLPRAMSAMAAMAGGIEAMTPALNEMASRMKDVIASADLPRD